MNTELTITCPVYFRAGLRGQKFLEAPPNAPPTISTTTTAAIAAAYTGRVPRLARLMALSIRLERLVAEGHVHDLAELARLGHVTRARMTQITNLRFLAPDIQDALLHLPLTEAGRDPIKEWQVRPIAATLDWKKQRRMWKALQMNTGAGVTGAHIVPHFGNLTIPLDH